MNVLGHARGSEDAGTTLAPGSPGGKDKESESWDTNAERPVGFGRLSTTIFFHHIID